MMFGVKQTTFLDRDRDRDREGTSVEMTIERNSGILTMNSKLDAPCYALVVPDLPMKCFRPALFLNLFIHSPVS
jgi:hypothetical protein